MQINQQYYQANISELDFQSPQEALSIINNWVSQKTQGKIDKIVDKIVWFVAPILIGNGRGALAEYSVGRLLEAPHLRDVQTERIGADIMISGYLNA